MLNRLLTLLPAGLLVFAVATGAAAAAEPDAELPPIGRFDYERIDFEEGVRENLQPHIIDQLLYPDGRILGLGLFDIRPEERAFLVRLTADGRPDTTFGRNGLITLANPGGNRPFQFAIDSKGRILVTALHYLDHPQAKMGGMRNPGAVFRFTADGRPDLTWGENGILLIDGVVRQTRWVSGMGVATLADDSVAVAFIKLHEAHPQRGGADTHRLAIMMLNEDGTPNTDFGTDGVAAPATADPLHIDSIRLTVLRDGSLLAYGRAENLNRLRLVPPGPRFPMAFFARLTPEGEWHPQVADGNGYTLQPIGEEARDASVNQVVLTDASEMRNGQILFSGYWLSSSLNRKFDSFVARYRPDGTLDPSFGGRNLGFSEIIRTTTPDWAFSITALPNGDSLVAGTDSKGGYLLRLNSNGTSVVWRREQLSQDSIDFRHVADPTGRVIITGGQSMNPTGMAFRRHNASGAADPRFGGSRDGVVRLFIRHYEHRPRR